MTSIASTLKGTPRQGLFGATLGFFIGFAAVALFGPTAKWFQQAMKLSPMEVGFLVAMPSLSGALLRIPFSAWVDTTGGSKPFLVLLALSLAGMAGLTATVSLFAPSEMGPWLYPVLLGLALLCGCGIATFSVGASQVSYWFPQKRQGFSLAIFAGIGNLAPGLFSLLIPLALASLGMPGSYAVWLALLAAGVLLYSVFGRNAWYFQLTSRGVAPEQARQIASERGQSLFPTGTLAQSLRHSAGAWRTWALVLIYFTTFGGFIALTAWLPIYWSSFFGVSAITAGLLTALYSVLTSVVRIIGGILSDHLREGGENTAILALLIMMAGALVMVNSQQLELALPGILLLAFGMGICNAAVFKIVPQSVPRRWAGRWDGSAGWEHLAVSLFRR
jgi:NNP family nitrate/nitrite transporter-like MFS transporter